MQAWRNVRQGRPLGLAPVGYKRGRNRIGQDTFLLDPDYKKHVVLMDRVYLKKKSADQVVCELYQRGLKSPRGKVYSKSQVLNILRNRRYTGSQDYKGEIHRGNWLAIRPIETYERIQEILQENRIHCHRPSRVHQKYIYLFQGLLKCSRCYSCMIPRPGTGGRNNKYYSYHACMKAEKTKGIECPSIYLSANAIDNALIRFIQKIKQERSVIEGVVEKTKRARQIRVAALKKDLSEVQVRLKRVRSRSAELESYSTHLEISKLNLITQKLELLREEEMIFREDELRLQHEMESEQFKIGDLADDQIETLEFFEVLLRVSRDRLALVKTWLPFWG